MSDIDRIHRQLDELSPEALKEVARLIAILLERRSSGSELGNYVRSFAGKLADSPNFNDDPVVIQQSLRDEW